MHPNAPRAYHNSGLACQFLFTLLAGVHEFCLTTALTSKVLFLAKLLLTLSNLPP